MVEDPPDNNTNGEVSPDRSPDEIQLPDDKARIPMASAPRAKHKRSPQSRTEIRPVKKPLFVTTAPVTSGASGARPQGTGASTAASGTAQAPFATFQPSPMNAAAVAGNTNSKKSGAQQNEALDRAVGQLVQSLRSHPQLHVPGTSPSGAVQPGTKKQVPAHPLPATVSVAGPASRPGPVPCSPYKSGPKPVSSFIQSWQLRQQRQTSGLGTGSLLPASRIAPKPLLNAPMPVPPRPPMRSIALRTTLTAAQLASASLSSAVAPPATDAQTCGDSTPEQRNSANVQPHVSAAITTPASAGQGITQPVPAAHAETVHPGHQHTAPVYVPKSRPPEQPDRKALPQMLAQVYAEQGDTSAAKPPQVRNEVSGDKSRQGLQPQRSIDVLCPPSSNAAAAVPVPIALKPLPEQPPTTDLASAARAMLSLQGNAAGAAALAAMGALDGRLLPHVGASAAAVPRPAPARQSSAPVPGSNPAAVLTALSHELIRMGSNPMHAAAVLKRVQSAAPAIPADVQRQTALADIPIRKDPTAQAQLANPPAPLAARSMQQPPLARVASQGHNPAAAIAAAARATAGKHVHPTLNFGPAASLASLFKQLHERPTDVAGNQPTTSNAPHVLPAMPPLASVQDLRPQINLQPPGPDAGLLEVNIWPDQPAAQPEPTQASVNECSVAETVPGSVDSNSTVTASAVTLQHLLHAGLIPSGVDVLQYTNGEKKTQLATLNADGTVQVKHAPARSLAEAVAGVRNGKRVSQEAEEEAWHCVSFEGRTLQHYRRRYVASIGAAPECPPVQQPATALPQTPFVWRFFDDLARQQHADTGADDDVDVGAAGDGEQQQEEEDAEAVVVPSPPRKRARRQATTVVSYAKLATEGVQEDDNTGKGSGQRSRQGGSKCSREPSPVPCAVEDMHRPVDQEWSKPLDITLLQGVARFAHLQPPPLPSAAPLAPFPVPSKPVPSKPAEAVLKRTQSAAKAAAQAAAQHNHHTHTAGAAGMGPLQPLEKMAKLPPMPRKLKSFNSALPNAPKPAPSTTAACAHQLQSTQRSIRESRAASRPHGVSGLTHTMMQLEAYTRSAGEPGADAQPFSVDVHPVVLVAMDIHAHLCQNEIIGVLGGRYDAQQGRLVVLKSLSVQEGVLDVGKTDVEMDPADQSRAIEELQQEGLQCVGWYHSHPTFPVWPSAIDVYNQQIQQVARSHEVTNGCATPYIAAIVGPYDQKNAGAQCAMSWFYVENKRLAEFSLDADPEVCLQHMVPKALSTTLIVDAQLPVSHITNCAADLIERYAGYSSRTELRSFWRGDMTCLQKLVSSVFHSVRGFLDTDALREVGTSITSCALQHFYGVHPSSLQGTSKRLASRSQAR